MRWIPYFILAYFSLALQIGLSPFIEYHGAAPNLVLLAVVFVALNAPRDAALLGCFVLGLLQDLISQQPLGLFAFCYGIVGWFIINVQQVVYKKHPLTHFSLCLLGGLITASVMLVHSWVRPAAPRVADGRSILPAIHLSIAREMVRMLYTAILAVPVLEIVQRIKGAFGFHEGGRRVRAW